MTAVTNAPGAGGVRQAGGVRAWAAARGLSGRMWLAVPGALFMVAFFVYPVIYGVGLSLQGQGGVLSSYTGFFSQPYLRDTIWITLKIALPAALITVAAALPVAYRMRGRLRAKRLIIILIMIPMTLGAVFIADGMIDFLGPQGWLNRVLMSLHLIGQPLVLIHNTVGVVLSMVIAIFPLAFLLTLGYVSGIHPSLESAAAVLGAGPAQRFWRVLLPLLAPGLTITFCLAFVMSFQVFPSAVLVGDPAGATHVISLAAYQQYSQADYSSASAIAMVMAVVQLAVLGAAFAARSLWYRGPTTGGKG